MHTTVIGEDGKWVEVQIRSQRMDEIAEKGYAAHWKYKQVGVKESSIDEWIEKIRVPSENNPSYGYMWWLNRGNRKWDGLPENIYYGSGFGGNYVIVIPDNDLVIVARWLDSSKVGEFVRKIVESIN